MKNKKEKDKCLVDKTKPHIEVINR